MVVFFLVSVSKQIKHTVPMPLPEKKFYKRPKFWLGTLGGVGSIVCFAVAFGIRPKEKQLNGMLEPYEGKWVVIDSKGQRSKPFTSADEGLAAHQTVTMWVDEEKAIGTKATPGQYTASIVLFILGVLLILATGVVAALSMANTVTTDPKPVEGGG